MIESNLIDKEIEPAFLTIAIPTWNRAKLLDQALSKLLPQIRENKDRVELIISDNHSTDETNEIILKYFKKYRDLNFIHYTQAENTGYYGNFRKCRELSTGNWFWMLSDNDYVNDNLLEFLINIIKQNEKCSAIFLQDWVNYTGQIVPKANYNAIKVTKQELVEKAGYKLTLISSVLIKNNKNFDNDIFDNFKSNSFLGFTFFLASIYEATEAIIVRGTSLLIYEALVSFNVFTSFAIDLVKCVNYARVKSFINEPFETALMTSVILNNTKNHYITYKIKKVIYSRDCGNIKDIEKLLIKGFGKYEAFNKHIFPLFFKTRFQLFIEKYLNKKIKNLFKKTI